MNRSRYCIALAGMAGLIKAINPAPPGKPFSRCAANTLTWGR